jgi:hypothetical protein
MQPPVSEVTGVATGSLGTGTALDDTQLYDVDALRTAEHPDELDAPQEASDRAVAAGRTVAPGPPVQPVRTERAAPSRPRGRLTRRRTTIGGYPIGLVGGAAIAVVAVAALLTMRDGISFGGSPAGPGVFAGANSFPPQPTNVTVPTAAPRPPPAQGHGNGHGHGRGH